MRRISRLRLWLLEQLFGDPPGEHAWAIFSHNVYLCQMRIREAQAHLEKGSENDAALAQADAILEEALREPTGLVRNYWPYHRALDYAAQEAEDYLRQVEGRSNPQVQRIVRAARNMLVQETP